MISSYKIKQEYRKNGRELSINSALVNRANGNCNRFNEEKFPAKPLFANKILNALDDDDYARFAVHLQVVSLQSGEVIYQPEDDCNYIYFPETAVFSQMNTLESGKTVEIALVGHEGIIGLSSILGREPTNLGTQTLLSGSAFRIGRKIFNGLFAESSLFQSSFFEYLNAYIRQVSQRAVCNNHHRIEHRFATWLLMLADRSRQDNLVLTQEQIAAVLGVQRPSVTGIAQNLRSLGTIDYVRGRIDLNRQKLEKTACECYSVVR